MACCRTSEGFMLLLLLGSLAQAGGYYFSDSGIVASGRAGAWVAGADTQFAQYYNPAGLIRVDAPSISAGLSGVRQGVRFDRIDDAGNALDPARNRAPAFPVPQLGFASPLGDDAAIAFGMTSPFAPTFDYDPEGAQRYGLIDSTIWLFSFGPSGAYKPLPWLTIGAGIGMQMLRVDQRIKVTTSGPRDDGSDRENGDVLVDAQTWDYGKPFWNVGVLIDPDPRVSIGLSMTPPARFRARGPANLDFTGHSLDDSLDQSVWTDERVTLNINLPIVLRAGVAIRPRPNLEIELATVYERWSSLTDIMVEDIDITVRSSRLGIERDVPPTLALPAGFGDNFSLRLGGEWRANDAIELRGGVMWERGSLPPERISVALVDPWKLQFSSGASLWLVEGRLRFDGMASYLHMPTLNITNSEVTQVGVPVLTDSVNVGTVGNGTLRSHGWTTGLRAVWILTKHTRKNPRNTTPPPAKPDHASGL